MAGFVSLIGAGPGHPDNLTLRGLRALRAANVVLYDALLDPGFRDLFPPGALASPVGKRCGAHRTHQDAIHDALIAHARAGLRVARLKGGDPFVFGRGGEEALALGAAGIPFEVIPGVSAANGIAAAALIPLTHRGVSREVRVVEGALPRSDEEWRDLAAFRGTVVLYMASRRLREIATALLAAGAEVDWPVALVENGCTARQTVSAGDLRDASTGRLASRTGGPGLVIMGPTVRLRAGLLGGLAGAAQHGDGLAPDPGPHADVRWLVWATRSGGNEV